MFIIFNNKSQAINYIKKRSKQRSHNEGCGCCWSYDYSFIDGNKVVRSYIESYRGTVKASAVVIGKIKKKVVRSDALELI